MHLTREQEYTLVQSIAADPVLRLLPHDDTSAWTIAAQYNQPLTPTYWVYRTSVAREEIVFQTSQDGTTFTLAGNGFIGRTQGEFEGWHELFGGGRYGGGAMNPSLPKVRDAIADIFSGTGNAAQNRAHIAAVWRRPGSFVEHLYVSGQGTTGQPGTMATEGPLLPSDVVNAWGSTDPV